MKRLQQAAADLTRRGRSRWVCIEWPLENIVRSYILYLFCYLYFISQSSSLYWVTSRRYCEKLHHWEPSIYQSLTTTFFQRMLFLQFIIVRRYITGNPPSQEAFISHWLPHSLNECFSSNLLKLIISIRMDRGRYQMLPSGWGKSICLFFVSCCLSDDIRARLFMGLKKTRFISLI